MIDNLKQPKDADKEKIINLQRSRSQTIRHLLRKQPQIPITNVGQYNISHIPVASFVQDCFLPNCPKSTLFGVFDGHGGKQVSTKLVTFLPNVWDM